MSAYPEPRRLVLTATDFRRLTWLEHARSAALAGLALDQAVEVLRKINRKAATPDESVAGTVYCYAVAYALERRLDPTIAWEVAQTWDVRVDLDEEADPLLEAEARAGVEAALATGLPPATAGELTLSQIDAYRAVRAEAAEAAAKGRRPRARRARVHR